MFSGFIGWSFNPPLYHPSIKQRYEKAVANTFEKKNPMDIIHTRKLLYKINEELQGEKCWSVEDKNWWII